MDGRPTGFWGKLRREGDDIVAWHPLEDHCADVAACAVALLQTTNLRSRLARLGGLDDLGVVQVARIGVLAALHDLGKFNQGFQNKGRVAAFPMEGHVREVALLFDGSSRAEVDALRAALPLDELETWGDDDAALRLLLAAIGHHGRPAPIEGNGVTHSPSRWRAVGGLDPFEGIRRLVVRAFAWFPEATEKGSPLPSNALFQHGFSGLVMLADWLGSDTSFFPFAAEGDDRIGFAREAAARSLREIHLDATADRSGLRNHPPDFDTVSSFPPHDAQVKVMETALSGAGTLTLMESETGSGKTEAALARFVQLFDAGLVDGMYFALPTRTAATQIHERVRQAVARAFPNDAARPPVVLAVPGYLTVDDRTGSMLAPFEVLWNDDSQRRFRHRGWAAENPKRYLAASIAVGTVDQALLSTLMVDHAHLRATALLRQFLVVDEVHASDTYMTRLLEGVLGFHLAAGGHAFLMSATLGSSSRDRLFKQPQSDYANALAAPYPLISHRVTGCATTPVPAKGGRSRTVRVEQAAWIGSPETVAEAALGHAARGARVLVLRNTVRDCIDTQESIERLARATEQLDLLFGCNGRHAPHHARFARRDRTALDDAIDAAFGKHSPSRGCVVVATQTVQQSLDLDADILLTDLCPMDVLLQRIGRLHRHLRVDVQARPEGYEEPVVRVLVPDERDLATLVTRTGEPRGKHGHGTVYDDLRVLDATWCQISERTSVSIPEDNRKLVEATTHPSKLAEIEKRDENWKRHGRWIHGQFYGDRRAADMNLVPRETPFGDLRFPDGDLGRRISTRLGEGDRSVRLPEPVTGPFGASVQIFTVPAWQAREVPADAEAALISVSESAVRFAFGDERFVYTRLGLQPERQASAQGDPTDE